MDVREKVVLVTGAASGIGAALARRFADEGAGAVIVTDIDAVGIAAVADEIGGAAFVLDVTDESRTAAVIAEVEEAYGPIDLLCHTDTPR